MNGSARRLWLRWRLMEATMSTPGPRYCQHCGASNQPEAQFCAACGKMLNS